MERKKLPNDFSLDDLIQLAVNDSEESSSDLDAPLSDVIAFLSHYKLAEGKHRTTGKALHSTYKNWSKYPCTLSQFNYYLSLYIPRESRYYLINKSPSELIADLASVLKKTKPPLTRKKAYWEHFKAFLKAVALERGEAWIEAHVIAHFYDKWSYNKKKKQLSKNSLYSFLKIMFETRQTKDGLVVKVKHSFELSSVQNIRDAWKRKQKEQK